MGEKKEPIKMRLSTLFLILIIFVLLTIILVMYLENKNIISINLKENINETIIENKVENVVEDVNDKENKIEKIILEGNYVIKNSDFGYTFYKDGIVKSHGNVEVNEGTYYTVGENKIEIKFIKKTIFEDGNIRVENVNRIENCIIKDSNTLYIEYEENGEKYEYDIVKYEYSVIVKEKGVYKRLKEKYSDVVYRRDEENGGYYLKVFGKYKYVIPLDKQIGTVIILTTEGKVFKSERDEIGLETFKELDFGYKIIEVINLPEIEGYLFLADDGIILNIDGTIIGKV